MTARLRLGTRGSPLALAQAHETRDRLRAAHADLDGDDAVEIVVIKTTGDAIQDRTLSEAGGKGLFTKEIEEALLDGSIDIAVHSMKDVPTWLPDGLMIDCILEREDPRDALISPKADSLAALPEGSVVGTASLRRQAQVLAKHPHLRVEPLRGNLQTRMRKLSDGVCDATFLAVAGLNRMGMADAITAVLDMDDMLPAVAQGAIGLEVRAADDATRARIAPLNHADTATRLAAERAFLAVLDGSCRTPIAGHAVLENGTLRFAGEILKPDGSIVHATTRDGAAADAEAMGRDAGAQLKAEAGPDFLTT
jgi:hydroxymethylbilane synthase